MNGCHARSVTGEHHRLLFDESLLLHVLGCLEPQSEGEPSTHLSTLVTHFTSKAFKNVKITQMRISRRCHLILRSCTFRTKWPASFGLDLKLYRSCHTLRLFASRGSRGNFFSQNMNFPPTFLHGHMSAFI